MTNNDTPSSSETLDEAQEISDTLRTALDERREVGYEEDGNLKVICVIQDGKRYEFYKDNFGTSGCWYMRTYINNEYDDLVELENNIDIDYLEELFEQDIPNSLRTAINEKHEVEYDDFHGKIIKVRHHGRTYEFIHDICREYSDWAMIIYDENGELVDNVDIRLDTDTDYLETLFTQDIPESLRTKLQTNGEFIQPEGENKVRKVRYKGRIYEFHYHYYYDHYKWPEWYMKIYENENDQHPKLINLHKDPDTEFLDELFKIEERKVATPSQNRTMPKAERSRNTVSQWLDNLRKSINNLLK